MMELFLFMYEKCFNLRNKIYQFIVLESKSLFNSYMETFRLNTMLIKAVKKQVPVDTNLAIMLMDFLCLGKEATYRRLRGEVPFTFAEAATISQKFGISLDELINTSISEHSFLKLTCPKGL